MFSLKIYHYKAASCPTFSKKNTQQTMCGIRNKRQNPLKWSNYF